MNIYASDDYREILKTVIAEYRLLDDKVNFQNMASHIRIPKSYLSRVVHGKADLSGDQLYLACEFLNFSDKERSYLFLLLEYARAGLKRRKSQIKRFF